MAEKRPRGRMSRGRIARAWCELVTLSDSVTDHCGVGENDNASPVRSIEIELDLGSLGKYSQYVGGGGDVAGGEVAWKHRQFSTHVNIQNGQVLHYE